jgi:hypothetical protein
VLLTSCPTREILLDWWHSTGVKLFFTGPVVKTELLVVMLEKNGIAATQEFVDPAAPDDGDLDRPANVFVPEADFERARGLFFTEREDEL